MIDNDGSPNIKAKPIADGGWRRDSRRFLLTTTARKRRSRPYLQALGIQSSILGTFAMEA
jgi:hypothetical protein